MTPKGLISLIFHRTALVAALLLVQIVVIIVFLLQFSNYFVYFYWAGIILSVIAVIWVVDRQMDPGYKIAWIIPIMAVPVFGGLLYLLFCGNRLSNRQRRKMQGMDDKLVEILSPDFKAEHLSCFGLDSVNQARYLERIAHCPVYENTATEYFSLGDDAFPRMLEEISKAERYIFMEYFIIQEGKFWDAILEILLEKAKDGVDVRVIYDDVGSLFTLPKDYHQTLERQGIQCCVFHPFIPVLSTHLNNRDHRKMCIIDGHTAFTGGMNLADEYINHVEHFGHWKDSAILLQGEGAWSMVVMFLTMWEYTCGVTEHYEDYRPKDLPPVASYGQFVQPYTDSPLDQEPVGQTVYLNLITKAESYVYFTSPYLIPSDGLTEALRNAAKSGIDVRIMTPHIPDKKTIFELTRAHYESLLTAGVRIFEYTPGFVHGKNCIVDDVYGTVGSVNLDYRSMFLHFEGGVLLYHDPSVLDMKKDFIETLSKCEEITLERCRQRPWYRRMLRAILRVFAPLV